MTVRRKYAGSSYLLFFSLFITATLIISSACAKKSELNQLTKKRYTVNQLSAGGEPYISWVFSKSGENKCAPYLIDRLKSARQISFASYKPSHPSITSILKSTKTVQGFYDGRYCGRCIFKNKKIIPVKLKRDPSSKERPWYVMHHKFAVIHEEGMAPSVITGSFNWNKFSAQNNYDDMIEINSPATVAAFRQELENLSGKKNPLPSIVHDGKIHTAFNQACDDLLIPYIRNAKKSIHIAMYLIKPSVPDRDNSIYNEIITARRRGVRINIIADGREADRHDFDELKITKARQRRGFFHHKFMIIDEEILATGSFNYAYKAIHGNNETLLVIEEPLMAESYLSYWNEIHSRFSTEKD